METSHEKMNESIVANDLSVEALLAQIVELKNENQKATEEFGAQRAKLKELFLQREDELRKLRDEINVLRKELDSSRMEVTEARLDLESKEIEGVKNVEELSSLFQLLNSTLEESSRLKEEITKLKGHNEELETLLMNVKSANQNSSVSDLNLVNPGTMFTTLARKVKSQLGAADLVPHQVESLEENMRKAKEDAEVMKSLVLPLEEEIKALKTKLRETDEQLQKYQKEEATENVKLVDLGSPTEAKKNCVMCSNYETNLVQEQAKIEDLERQLAVMSKSKEELDKGIVFRKQLEEKWAESKEEHKTQVAELQGVIKELEGDLINLRKSFTKSSEKLKRDFKDLIEERRATEEKLNRLQLENEILVGKHSASATELQNEKINLPDSVDKLHEIWLTQREHLIAARVGQERSEENVKSLERLYKDTMDKVREQSQEINQLKRDLDQSHKETFHEKHLLQQSLQENTVLSQKSAWLESQVSQLEEEKKKLEKSEGELRNRLSSLQMGLENGEAVQKDFVMLSQSLQKELERLRSQNNTLRWEHEEDVHACNGCEQPFKSKKKINCKHCGRIFCNACLSHKVTSGPNQRESKVCQVCHTLLNSETAPYFSTEPPK